MPYFIWDTPDYKDLDKKLWTVTKLATIYSTASAICLSFNDYLPASGRAFAYIYARSFIPNVVAANAAMVTAYTVSRARGNVDNHWNYLPAAFVFAATSAGLRSVFNRNVNFWQRFGVAFLLMTPVLLSKNSHSQRKGGLPIRYPLDTEWAGDAFGNIRFYRPKVENMAQDWGHRSN